MRKLTNLWKDFDVWPLNLSPVVIQNSMADHPQKQASDPPIQHTACSLENQIRDISNKYRLVKNRESKLIGMQLRVRE